MSVLIKGVTKIELMKALMQSTYFLPDDIEIIEVPNEQELKKEEIKDVVKLIDFAINATGTNAEYSVGLCNGLKLAKSYLTGEEPKFDTVKNNMI